MENKAYIKLLIIAIHVLHSIDNDFTLVGKIYMYMVRMHWTKIEVKKMKRQNKTMKHTSKHRVFLFIVKRKIKYLNNFIKKKLVQY